MWLVWLVAACDDEAAPKDTGSGDDMEHIPGDTSATTDTGDTAETGDTQDTNDTSETGETGETGEETGDTGPHVVDCSVPATLPATPILRGWQTSGGR